MTRRIVRSTCNNLQIYYMYINGYRWTFLKSKIRLDLPVPVAILSGIIVAATNLDTAETTSATSFS